MRLLAVILLLIPSAVLAGPVDAVVRWPSHGCSATVIHSDQQHTFLLTCAHGFEGHGGGRMKFNFPCPADWPVGQSFQKYQKILAVDHKVDLSLIEVGGPAPYVCPVAVSTTNRNIVSVGYDEMKLPITIRRATVLGSSVGIHGGRMSDPTVTFTREPPWHGRSGGPLIDLDTGQLIGVCSAYAGLPSAAKRESPAGGPGIYCSLKAIQSFLQKANWNTGQSYPQGIGYYRQSEQGIDVYRGQNYELDPFKRYQQDAPQGPRTAPQCPS